jgi:hypothetical protein
LTEETNPAAAVQLLPPEKEPATLPLAPAARAAALLGVRSPNAAGE